MSKATIQEVNVESLFGALNTTGEAKLSDHATPVEQDEQQETPVATEDGGEGGDLHAETDTAERTTTETAERTEKPVLRFVDYSEKAFAIVGDTKAHKAQLKRLGGRFNPKLRCGAGWIFSKKRGKEVATALGFGA